MLRLLKISILIILVVGFLAIAYFELSNGSETSKIVISDEEIEEKKKQVVQELFENFKNIVKKIEEEDQDNFGILVDDLVIASGKANGLNVYRSYLTADERKWILKKSREIRDKMGSFSTVYFGYTKSGLEFIVLATPTMTNNFYYANVMNQIRKDENEAYLLDDIGGIWSEPRFTTFYALDVYVKDLLEYRKEFEIEMSIFYDGEIHYPINDIEDNQIDAILTEYNRSLEDTNIIKDQQWKLYLFGEDLGWPVIKIKYEGEEIILEN